MVIIRGFRFKAFLVTFGVVFFLTFITLSCALEMDAGGSLEHTWFVQAGEKIYSIFRFPAHTLFFNFFVSGIIPFISGLLLNCVFYSLIAERIIYFFRRGN